MRTAFFSAERPVWARTDMIALRCKSEQTGVRDAFGDKVNDEDEEKVDDRVEEADRGREAVVGVEEPILVDIGGDDFRAAQVERRLQQVNLLEAYAHQVAHGQDGQDDHGGADSRE